jgi:PAS domain S-box-containing protein
MVESKDFQMSSLKRFAICVCGLLVVAGVGLLIWHNAKQTRITGRRYRIGWEPNSPSQLLGPNGEPTGFAVELLRQAARRRGIRLTWVYLPESAEAALRRGHADLWPVMTITPERANVVHISPPFLESALSTMVRDDSAVRQLSDLAGKRIGYSGVPIDLRLLSRFIPHAHSIAMPQRSLLTGICTGEVDAAFIEAHAAIKALLDGGGCPGRTIRIVPNGLPYFQEGVGSTFESADAADALRDEIGLMAEAGLFPSLMAKWGFLPGRTGELIEAERNARRREQWLIAVAVVFAVLLMLAAWQAYSATQEREKVKRSELELRESERRFRGLLENVRMSATIMDLQGRFTFCNDYFLAATGWDRQELIGRPIAEFLVPEDRMRVVRIMESLSDDTPSHWAAEPGVLTKNGRVRWFQSNIIVLRDAKGRRVGFANLAIDITEHRALQEQYLQAQKMEGLGRLAGGVAHDFNNLLTVISGYTEIVRRKLQEGDPLCTPLDQVLKAGARAAGLTQQLLAFSRKQVIQPKPLNLNLVVADSDGIWTRLLGEAIHLETKLSPTLGQAMADAGQIHQVLMNLVVNARDAMPDGGRLTIETSDVDVDPSWLAEDSEAIAGPYVVLAVSDNGVGMDEDTRKRIFEPFFTTKPPGQGTGLGLATVYGIVKQSQGWIRVYSEPGAGTMFRIYLPRIQPVSSGSEESAAVQTGAPCSETILLVEDQEEVRQFAAQVLAECGYRVLSASSGSEALALVEHYSETIDVLVTDVVLPGMNGFELAKRLVALRPGIRVLFTSGYTGEVTTLRGILDRGLAYLPKPYVPNLMAAKVRAVIDAPAPTL